MTEKDSAERLNLHATLATLPTMMQPDALAEQLVGAILKHSPPRLAEALRLGAIPFWFDLELLATLRDSDDGLDEKILARMARFSFVQGDDRGRYTFSQDVRCYLLNEWGKDPEGFVEANRRAQSCLLQKLRAAFPDGDEVETLIQPLPVALPRALTEASPEVGELVQSYLYHTLAVDGDAGIVLLRRLFHAAEDSHRLALAGRYLELANEQRARLDPGQRAHIDYMGGLLYQLQGKWDTSRDLFRRMLSREGLPTTLQARVRRALGNTLVQQQQWVEAITLLEIALKDFQATDDRFESALTMIHLGQAHLDLALNTWGGGETFRPGRNWLDRVADMALLVSRLPIIVYLMSHLGVRALLPVIPRVGRDMDWVIARLFVTAAGWFHRADAVLRQLNDQEGLGRVEENLAWLYLLLGHFGQAETLYRHLLTHEGRTVGEYRAARARLSLAQALMHQGHLAEARELLEQVLPVFDVYQHTERIAQTHTTLAQSYALEREPAQAVACYQRAAQLYHQLDDDANATEVVEQMQLLREKPETDEAVRQSIATTAAQITHRRYLTRCGLPLLRTFRLLALVGLVGVLLFSLFTSIRVESGTDFGVGQALLSSRQSASSVLEPQIDLELVPRLQANFKVDFTLLLILGIVAAYLVIYTLLGLWFTVRTPLRTLQERQRFDLSVDPDGVVRGAQDIPGSLKIRWDQVATILSADRSLFRTPIPFFSRFALFGEQGEITIDGQTQRYLAARALIQERLDQSRDESAGSQHVPIYHFGFSILGSHSGRLLVSTLIFILAFILTARVAPQVLTTNLGPLPYSLADLYGISYLGLLVPLGWWLAVQPARERLFLEPDTRRVWLIGGVGLLLAAFTFVDLAWLQLPIGRPNVAPGLFAAFLVGLAAYYVLTTRRWEHRPFRRGDYVYALSVRLVAGVVALAVIVLTLGLVGREAGAYHYLATANLNRQRAADAAKAGDSARAQELYEKALSFYDRAQSWGNDDADTYHSGASVLAQLGRYEEAIASYQEAIALDPREGAYYNSLAITHELWAAARREAGDMAGAHEHYEAARDQYTPLIEGPGEDRDELATVYLLRAGTSFQIGEYFEDTKNGETAAVNYAAARADYERVLELQPGNEAALIGLGWAEYKLARLSDDTSGRNAGLDLALAYFERAVAGNPQQVSAWEGQGWTHFAIGEIYTWWDEVRGRSFSACNLSGRNPRTAAEKLAYREENLKAIEAFEQAATLAPDNADLHSVQGYIRFNLFDCPDVDKERIILETIGNFDRALALKPDELEWRLRRANLYFALGADYYPQAITDYEVLVSLQPNADWYWTLGDLYRAQEQLSKAVHAYASAVQLDPTDYARQVLLGWYAYQSGDYRLSIEASQSAAALDPTDPRPFFNAGLALVAMGDAAQARRVYEEGVAVANALVNPQDAHDRYDEALIDLSNVAQDPAGSADALRARMTFAKALVYVQSGDAGRARSAYEDGVAIADALTGRETRRALYDEAIEELGAVGSDPARIVAELLALLESARDK
jgi:tetratricopeptide (TPR) repeat protein